MNCRSCFVVYVLFCDNCSAFYIGKSEKPLHIRVNSHRFQLTHDINDATLPFIKHVKLCSNSFSVSCVHQSPKVPLQLEIIESYFINLLQPPYNSF